MAFLECKILWLDNFEMLSQPSVTTDFDFCENLVLHSTGTCSPRSKQVFVLYYPHSKSVDSLTSCADRVPILFARIHKNPSITALNKTTKPYSRT